MKKSSGERFQWNNYIHEIKFSIITSDLKKRNAKRRYWLSKKMNNDFPEEGDFGSEELQERLLHTLPHQMNKAKAYWNSWQIPKFNMTVKTHGPNLSDH